MADPSWDKRDGFSENNLAFLANGSLMCFLRTTDGNGVGPMYAAYSQDGGISWSRPQVFDDRGVWPAVVDLGCGTTLAAYGRPGLFVRATHDPIGQTWGERVTVVEPGVLGKDTCSYSDLLALDDHSAIIAYSHFGFPGPDGMAHKSILGAHCCCLTMPMVIGYRSTWSSKHSLGTEADARTGCGPPCTR